MSSNVRSINSGHPKGGILLKGPFFVKGLSLLVHTKATVLMCLQCCVVFTGEEPFQHKRKQSKKENMHPIKLGLDPGPRAASAPDPFQLYI